MVGKKKTASKKKRKLSFLPVPAPDHGRIVLGIIAFLILYLGIPFGNPMTIPELWKWLFIILLGATLYGYLKKLLIQLFEDAI